MYRRELRIAESPPTRLWPRYVPGSGCGEHSDHAGPHSVRGAAGTGDHDPRRVRGCGGAVYFSTIRCAQPTSNSKTNFRVVSTGGDEHRVGERFVVAVDDHDERASASVASRIRDDRSRVDRPRDSTKVSESKTFKNGAILTGQAATNAGVLGADETPCSPEPPIEHPSHELAVRRRHRQHQHFDDDVQRPGNHERRAQHRDLLSAQGTAGESRQLLMDPALSSLGFRSPVPTDRS